MMHAMLDGVLIGSADQLAVIIPLSFAILVCAMQDVAGLYIYFSSRGATTRFVATAIVLFAVAFPLGAGISLVVFRVPPRPPPRLPQVNLELMQEHAAGSVVVLALLSPDYFTSKFCRGELEAAAAAGVPIVPVFSGEDYPRKTILALLDAHRDDPEKAAAVKAAFGENLIDANNGDHADTVADDLNNKVIARFLDEV